MKSDYWFLALKNLRRRGIRSWLTLIGIIIGITAVVSLISLGDGLRTAINSQFGISSTEVISVQAGGVNGYGPPGTGVVNPLTTDDVDAIQKLDTVDTAIRRNVETVKSEFNKKLVIGFATNIPNGEKGKLVYQLLDIKTIQGRLLQDGDFNNIVVGNDFIDPNKNGYGKTVSVGDVITIQSKNFKVVGILQKKGSFILDKVILMNEDSIKQLLNLDKKVSIIGVIVKDKGLMDKAKEEIEKLMRERRNVRVGEEDFEVSTPQATLATINSILVGVQIFIVLIASISIIVGAIGIVNTMTTSVLERFKEIGIMKAIGAKNSDIFWQFFIEAGLMGLIGGFLGVILGSGIASVGVTALNNFLGATTSFKINYFLIFSALLGSFIVGSISGIAPALKAASLNPVEALRK